ncbi:hypothetical protein B7463_g3618, partial [Scytalidium lignicola]
MRIARITSLPLLLTFLGVVYSNPIKKRDADFYSVRTFMTEDSSRRSSDSPVKYFHESIFSAHYDGRFADRSLSTEDQKLALKNLMQTYLATCKEIGVETWLMHGTLLGWWWNRKILPWDSDNDVQMTETSMHYLASYYNMTTYHYRTVRMPQGRTYLLEVNPHYLNSKQTDNLNVIDARWIDTTSGLFIDITTARYNHTHPAGKGMLSCKDGHEYRDTYIFPLRDTDFEGAPAKIPWGYKDLLLSEYTERALTNRHFHEHTFDIEKREWIPVNPEDNPTP